MLTVLPNGCRPSAEIRNSYRMKVSFFAGVTPVWVFIAIPHSSEGFLVEMSCPTVYKNLFVKL